MNHLDLLRMEKKLRIERDAVVDDTKHEVFIVNDLIQTFGRDYLDWLHQENQAFADRHNYKTVIRPIPIEAAP